MNFAGLWDTLVDAICRPPRDKYQTSDLVGGRRGTCRIGGKSVTRQDLVLVNKKGQKLQCSHYQLTGTKAEQALPIVIYCHCNSGSRRDAEEAFHILLPHNISVFCLDFAGSGLSEGDWVTLGALEVDDLETAVSHLRKEFPESTIGLWGRSMGAVTALLYSARDPSIAGVVMDSPFARLTELMVELVDEQKLPIPKAFMRVALGMMRRSVRKRAGFNIDAVAPLEIVPQCFIPALFGHATEDTFVNMSHSQRLHAAYAGSDKNLVTFKGDHNSVRPQHFYNSVLMFLHTALRCPVQATASSASVTSPAKAIMPPPLDLGQAEGGSPRQDEVTPGRRELSPPWNREDTLSQSHSQLHEAFKSELSFSCQKLPGSLSGLKATERDSQPGAAQHNQSGSTSHWLDSDVLPPPALERAPWLEVHQDAAAACQQATQSQSAQAADRLLPAGSEAADADRKADFFVGGANELPVSHGSAGDLRAAQLSNGNAASAQVPTQRQRDPVSSSIEHRFWHLEEPSEHELMLSDADEDDEELARALEESMREAARQAQLHSEVATSHAGQETRLDELIPDSMRHISQEDAEELMLVEAIKASLLEAERCGTASNSPQASAADVCNGRGGDHSGSGGAVKQRSRGLFWGRKTKDGASSPKAAAHGENHRKPRFLGTTSK